MGEEDKSKGTITPWLGVVTRYANPKSGQNGHQPGPRGLVSLQSIIDSVQQLNFGLYKSVGVSHLERNTIQLRIDIRKCRKTFQIQLNDCYNQYNTRDPIDNDG